MTSMRAVGYRATATRTGKRVASSQNALRLDRPGDVPTLWFPGTDVDLPSEPASWWRAGDGELADHVAFDPERVELLLVDSVAGDDERDVTTKRFPTWGDVADLVGVLDVVAESPTRYRSDAYSDGRRPVVEGSQILGQAIVAAGRFAPGRRVVSASMIFNRAVDAGSPYFLELDPVSTGRTFSAIAVRAVQADRVCAIGHLLLDVTAPDVIRHADPAPDVAGPYDSEPLDMSVTGRDLRVVDSAYTGDPDAPQGPPEIDAWVRFRDVPDDQPIHAGLLAQFTGHMAIAAGLRPHAGVGQDQAHRTLSTAINAISLSIHADVHADDWMLYHHRSTSASEGMTHAECRVHDLAGGLIASFTVDAMVRGFADPTANDPRRAL